MTDLSQLEKYARDIRKDLDVPKQNDVFEVAAEAGYLAAVADEILDDDERATMVRAIEVLSVGAVIEWEVETLIDRCIKRTAKEGNSARVEAVGKKLAELGQPAAGLLYAAFVAQATAGIDKKELSVLHALGKAAGLSKNKVNGIVKRVGASEA